MGKAIGDSALWDEAEAALAEALKEFCGNTCEHPVILALTVDEARPHSTPNVLHLARPGVRAGLTQGAEHSMVPRSTSRSQTLWAVRISVPQCSWTTSCRSGAPVHLD